MTLHLKQEEQDECPAGRYEVAGFIMGIDKPKDEFSQEDLPKEHFIVHETMCSRCPDRSTMWVNENGNITIRCQYEED